MGLQTDFMLDYAEAVCAVTGEMNESRKAVFIKVSDLLKNTTLTL